MAEWVKVEGLSYECHKLRVGRVLAVASGACPSWEPGYSIEHDTDPMTFEQESVDAAKTAAEQALREMHEALAAHFAPVLTWQESAGGWVAFLGQWMLEADSLSWSVSIKSQASSSFKLVSWGETTLVTERAVNRRDAEAALRSLGVTFRTEGER